MWSRGKISIYNRKSQNSCVYDKQGVAGKYFREITKKLEWIFHSPKVRLRKLRILWKNDLRYIYCVQNDSKPDDFRSFHLILKSLQNWMWTRCSEYCGLQYYTENAHLQCKYFTQIYNLIKSGNNYWLRLFSWRFYYKDEPVSLIA